MGGQYLKVFTIYGICPPYSKHALLGALTGEFDLSPIISCPPFKQRSTRGFIRGHHFVPHSSLYLNHAHFNFQYSFLPSLFTLSAISSLCSCHSFRSSPRIQLLRSVAVNSSWSFLFSISICNLSLR